MSYASARSRVMAAVIAAVPLFFLLPHANAASALNSFAPNVNVQGTPLALNGAGTRFKSIFKVYDLGLYTTRKVETAEALLALQGPKRLQFVALRELSTNDLGRLFAQGIADNSPRELTQRHVLAMARLAEVFSVRTKLLIGERFAMDFVPGKGVIFTLDDKVQGEPVGDAEFFNMILLIWMGATPADRSLKDALLGHDKQPASVGPER